MITNCKPVPDRTLCQAGHGSHSTFPGYGDFRHIRLDSEYCATYGPAYGANSDETLRIMHYQGKRAFTATRWVTILPVTCQATGVTTSNLKFPLYDATLQRGSTLGVSNEMLERTASVSIAKGFAVVVLSRRSRSS